MLYRRQIGAAEVWNFVELLGPTHDPAVVLPDLPSGALAEAEGWMAPHHLVPAIGRLIVGIQIWMVRLGSEFVVIDCGVGNAKPRGLPRFHRLNTLFPHWLHAAGATPDRVTQVINTHLHGDHVGWNTVAGPDGGWLPFFPNAQYWMPEVDLAWWIPRWQAAGGVGETEALTDSVLPLVESGRVRTYGAGQVFAAGFTAWAAPGHTPGQHRIDLEQAGARGSFCADIFHSPIQIAHPHASSAYCVDQNAARATRLGFLDEVAGTGTLVMPCHFGFPHCGTVERDGAGYRFIPESRG